MVQREEYETWSDSVVDFQVKNGGGIALSLTGYEDGLGRDFELRLDEFPVIELWKKKESEDSFNTSIKYTHDASDDTLGKELVQYLTLVDGDVLGSTYESLYKYYKELADSRLRTVNKAARKAKKNADVREVENEINAKDMLKQELDPDTLKSFLMTADRIWYEAILGHYKKFHTLSDVLIEKSIYVQLFDDLEKDFPLHAAALLNISVCDTFYKPGRFTVSTFNERKKAALMYFFAMCRARNKSNMKYWAMIETLAIFGKGISSVTTRSTASRSFCTVLRYALRKVDEIHDL